MYISLKLPLNPNRRQHAAFVRFAGSARWVYNWALQQCKEAREAGEKRPSAYDLQKRMTWLKRQPETAWLSAGELTHVEIGEQESRNGLRCQSVKREVFRALAH